MGNGTPVCAHDWWWDEVLRERSHDWALRTDLEHHFGLGRGPQRDGPTDHRDPVMVSSGVEATVVAGRRVYGVRVADVDPPRRVVITIAVDGRFEWAFDAPGWRPISVGHGASGTYLWSARDVIGLPAEAGGRPCVKLSVDEDLLAAFNDATGWVLVCETSVRRVYGGQETSRLELDAVALSFFWAADDVLVVRGDDDSEHRVTVRGAELEV